MNQRMIDESFRIASSRQMCCRADLQLLIDILEHYPAPPEVLQLGAGSGTMALAILGVRPDVTLWTIDNDQENLRWEALALGNAGFNPGTNNSYCAILSDSAERGYGWSGRIDLVVIDADHSYRGVKRDLAAWGDKAELVFCHDYDGTTAPERYPGVKRACDEYFDEPPIMKEGWSAVFKGLIT